MYNMLTATVKAEEYVSLKALSSARSNINYLMFKFITNNKDFSKINKIKTIFYFDSNEFNNIFLDDTHESVNNFKAYIAKNNYEENSLFGFYAKNLKPELVSRRAIKNNSITSHTINREDLKYNIDNGYLTFNLNSAKTNEIINTSANSDNNVTFRNFFYDENENIILDTGFTTVNTEQLINDINFDNSEVLTDDIFDSLLNTIRLAFDQEENIFNIEVVGYSEFFVEEVVEYDIALKYKNKVLTSQNGLNLEVSDGRICSFSPDVESVFYDMIIDYMNGAEEFVFDIQIYLNKNDNNYYGSNTIVLNRFNTTFMQFIRENLTDNGNTFIDSYIKKKINLNVSLSSINKSVSKLTISHNIDSLDDVILNTLYVKEVRTPGNISNINDFYNSEDIFNISTYANTLNTLNEKISLSRFFENSSNTNINEISLNQTKVYYINTHNKNLNNLKFVLYRQYNHRRFEKIYNINFTKTKSSEYSKKDKEKVIKDLLKNINLVSKVPVIKEDLKLDSFSQISTISIENIDLLNNSAKNDFNYDTNESGKSLLKNTLFRITTDKQLVGDDSLNNLSKCTSTKTSSLENLINFEANNAKINENVLKEINLNDEVLNNNAEISNKSFSVINQNTKFEAYPIPSEIIKYKNKGLDNFDNILNFYNNQEEANNVNLLFYRMFYEAKPDLSHTEFLKIKRSFFGINTNSNVFEDAVFRYLTFEDNSKSINNSVNLSEINNATLLFDENESTTNNTFGNLYTLSDRVITLNNDNLILFENKYKNKVLYINIRNKIDLIISNLEERIANFEKENVFITCNVLPRLTNTSNNVYEKTKLNNINIENNKALPSRLFYNINKEKFRGISRGIFNSTIVKIKHINHKHEITLSTSKNKESLLLEKNLIEWYSSFIDECLNNEINFLDDIFIIFNVCIKVNEKIMNYTIKQSILEKRLKGIIRIDELNQLKILDTL